MQDTDMKPLDLSAGGRRAVELTASTLVACLRDDGQSLAIAREAMINAFDEEAAR